MSFFTVHWPEKNNFTQELSGENFNFKSNFSNFLTANSNAVFILELSPTQTQVDKIIFTDFDVHQRSLKVSFFDMSSEFNNFDGHTFLKIRSISHLDVFPSNLRSREIIKFNIGSEKWEVHEMSKIPRALLAWALTKLKSHNSYLARRLAMITANMGVPVHFLDSFPDLGISYKNLERFGLPLNSWISVQEQVMADPVLQFVTENLKDATFEVSSEATLRSHVWDPLLSQLIFGPTRMDRKFYGVSEWKSRQILTPQLNECRIDWVAILNDFNLPVFLVEIGKERTPSSMQHKDFTKLLCMMSQICYKLCEEMRKVGKNPNVIRIYGLWIGHSQFQLCVAHPVFTDNISLNRIDISVHISFPSHWRFDLFQGVEHVNCRNLCCNYFNIEGGLVAGVGRLTLPVVTQIPADQVIESFQEDLNLPAGQTPPTGPLNRQAIDIKSLCKLKIFVNCILNTIGKINQNHDDIYGNNPRPFVPPPSATIPTALASSLSITPSNQRINTAPPLRTPGSPTRTIFGQQQLIKSVIKPVSMEVEFYQRLGFSEYSNYFATVFGSHIDDIDPKFHVFAFEKLEKLSQNGHLNTQVIRWASPEQLLLEASTFAVHVLFGLLILHEKFGLVHSDISPNNVMFSSAFKIWKINDFNQAMSIEESLATERWTVGTKYFIAPESESTGIFSPASDVYALGQILLRYFYFALGYNVELEHLPQNILSSIEEFQSIASKLTNHNSSQRLTVREALKEFKDFTLRNLIEGFDLYGMGLIFFKIEQILMSQGSLISSTSSSTSIPMARIEQLNVSS